MRYNKETADNLVAAQSWTRYDPLIAIPCLSSRFARLDLHLTFFVPLRQSLNTFLSDGRRCPLRVKGRERLATRISRRLDARRFPALRPQPRSRLSDADLPAATGNGSLPQRVRRPLEIWCSVDLGLASGIVRPPCLVQGGS